MADDDTPVSGRCAERFLPVRRAFAANFRDRGEVGAAVCVIIDDEVVVDLVGGWRDADRTEPWTSDTLVDIYSAGKGLLATLGLQLVDRGALDLDARVADLWPEFAEGGKEGATVRHAFAHQAGVPAIVPTLTDRDLWRWDRMTAAVAATPAWFEPGSRIVYHTNTYGHLVGELVRRASGRSPGSELRELAGQLDADVWCGLPADEQRRCAEVIWRTPAGAAEQVGQTGQTGAGPDETARMIQLAYMNPPGYSSLGVVNTPEWRGAQIPAANMHATARGLARVYAGLLPPDRVLSARLLAEATRVQASGFCPVLGEEIRYGLGFVPTSERRRMGTNPRAFGHFGTGGAVGFADPDAGLAFGYVMNQVTPRWQSTRNRALIDTLYAVLDGGPVPPALVGE